MQQLIEFTMNHLILIVSFIAVASYLLFTLIQGDKGSIDPLGATEMINHQEGVVVDIRPAADYQKGHIINAINIPSNNFSKQINTLNKHKEQPVIVACRSGSQSQPISQLLRKSGFDKAYSLRGGLLAWQSANLPLTKKK